MTGRLAGTGSLKQIAAAALIGAAAVFVFAQVVRGSVRLAIEQSCDLVERHYYRADEAPAQAWLRGCRALANKHFLSKRAAISELNGSLERLGASHLSVYDPAENRQMWSNQSTDTGARARMAQGALVIFEILPASPAERAGLRLGDEIETVDGVAPGGPWDARKSGTYRVRRRDEETGADRTLSLQVNAEDLAEDLSPSFEGLGGGVARVRLASFLPQYFERDEWIRFAARWTSGFHRLVLDMRGNAGGSFPAMLRAASTVFCRQESLGVLIQASARRARPSVDLEDDLDGEKQIAQLASADSVQLRAFRDYPCYRGDVIALVDAGTSSAAEVFAHAIAHRARSRVWGQATAGQVVLARWFPLALFGGDYSLSIPVAGFEAPDGRVLESEGVMPERVLYYRLEAARRGEDSWLDDAL